MVNVEDSISMENSRIPNLTPNDPLWIHHSEPSNYVLSTRLLNDRNYYKWRRVAEVSLKEKNKMAFVTGDLKKPASDAPFFAQWERGNSLVTSWIFHSVEKDIAESLLFYDTAVEIWSDLKLRFGAPNCSRIFQVQKELFTVSQGSMSISSYYTAFKRLWDEYFVLVDLPKCSACGVVGSLPQLLHTLQNIQFLVGLNDDYTAVRTNILMMKPVPTLAEVYQIVLQDEGQRELKSNPTVGSDSTALNSYQKLQGKFYCFNSSKGMDGWIIDSGATHHITPNLSLFSSYEALSTPDFITMPDGSQSQITHVGIVKLNDQYVLRNVLCVPGFTFNLLSVSQFSKDLSLMDRSMKASQFPTMK
ncbi:hypothetical protein V2J09_005939 [Rumex salicifolius]